MTYCLFIDDNRMLGDVPIPDLKMPWALARSSGEAKGHILQRGIPAFISFDHDLGGDDTSMKFLKWFSALNLDKVPEYQVHSANPVGKENIIGFMESWKRSLVLPARPEPKVRATKPKVEVPCNVKLSHIRDYYNPKRVLTLAREISDDGELIGFGFSVNRVSGNDVEQFNRKEGNRLAIKRLQENPVVIENNKSKHPLRVISETIASMSRVQLADSQIPFTVQDVLVHDLFRMQPKGDPTDRRHSRQ